MSSIAIEQVLAQIRSLSADAGSGLRPATLRPPTLGAADAAGIAGTAGAGAPAGSGFAELFKRGIDAVNASQQSADALATAWEKGTPGVDLARVMVEAQKASVSFQALTQVRNRLISAYQDIMNMQI